jgi:hypothetical protein
MLCCFGDLCNRQNVGLMVFMSIGINICQKGLVEFMKVKLE